ncbi:MAG: hypothetical protein IT427_17855 [Pirellulales bacterium]|nr:hypothetical protein [Pirellulales bacterium]
MVENLSGRGSSMPTPIRDLCDELSESATRRDKKVGGNANYSVNGRREYSESAAMPKPEFAADGLRKLSKLRSMVRQGCEGAGGVEIFSEGFAPVNNRHHA